MVKEPISFKSPVFSKRVLVIVGGYGTGKSEVSVNLACLLASKREDPVAIADLDIVNPYFRSREAAEQLTQLGVESIHPPGSQAYADLPIIIPRVKSAIEGYEGTLILDVGGDDAGARVLSSLAGSFPIDDHDVLFVLNANRPFNTDVDSCLQMMRKIEVAARLQFTGIISNTHMIEHTTDQDVLKGLDLTRKLSKTTSLPVSFVAAMRSQLREIDPENIDVPILPLDRLLLRPWEKASDDGAPSAPTEEQ
ncbi:MAG: hypothetical protein KOO62_13415 [candidate division Zixibacteria bacterium]|nr:hypothetical protein [candidate division Zixibacteria bacterium]